MRRIVTIVCMTALLSSFLPAAPVRSAEATIVEVDAIGVMPTDYVGTMTLESVNTVEQDYDSHNAFPSQGVAVLSSGDVVVCDTSYGRLHVFSSRLEHQRTIGSPGSGTGRLQYPIDVAVDDAGNMYVADFFGNKVTKYAANGSVALEFGSEGMGAGSFMGPAGIAVTTDGSIWVADQLNNRVEQFNASGARLASVTGIPHPAGMTAVGTTPYVIAEDGAVYTIRNGGAVRVFAAQGDGENLIASGADLAVDGNGDIYVADRGTGDVPVPGVKVFSGNGQYLRSLGRYPEDMTDVQDGELLSPGGVAVAADGAVYVMNSGFFRNQTNPFGSGFRARLVEYTPEGGVVNALDYGIDEPGRLNNPQDVAIDGRGQLWVACSAPSVSADGQMIEWDRGYVQVLDSSGNAVFTVMKAGSRSIQFVQSVGANGNGFVYVGVQDVRGGFIAVYDESGNYIRTIASGSVDEPSDIEVGSDGTLWVCNQGDGSVVHLTSDGRDIGRFPTPGMPGGLSITAGGNLLVCVWGESSEVQQVLLYTSRGALVRSFGISGGGRGSGRLYYPHDAVLLTDGLVLVSDSENGRFVAFRPDGTVAWTTDRTWYIPGRMAWSSNGLLYMTDGFHNVLRVLQYGDAVPPDGTSVTARFDTALLSVRAGSTARLQVNFHNWSARTDTYAVTASVAGTAGWSCTANPPLVTVASGATGIVSVDVQVPPDLPVGTAATVTVTAHGSLTLTGAVSVRATVEVQTPSAVIVGGSSVEAEAGTIVIVPVQARHVESLYAAGCSVRYDTADLELVAVQKGDLLGDDVLFVEDHVVAGQVLLGVTRMADAAPVSVDGTIAVLSFRALQACTTQLDIVDLRLLGGDEGRDEIHGKGRSIPVRIVAAKPRTTLVLCIGSSIMKVGVVNANLDAPPVIVESRTVVPIRAVAEALGGKVSWDASTRTVTVVLGNVSLRLTIGRSTALVNGNSVPIDDANPKVVPLIMAGRTMLPLRFVAENLGADVQWDGTTQTITVIYPRP